jgi:hypothetical protein
MTPNEWGPPIWTLFHTLAEKIKEENFSTTSKQLMFYIKRICATLPCPECSQHASRFLSRVNIQGIQCKTDLRNILYIFHNVVNKRKNKPLFNNDNLTTYATKNKINVYNNFVSAYQTKGNMKLLADSFQRKLIIMEFKKWFIQNINNFD